MRHDVLEHGQAAPEEAVPHRGQRALHARQLSGRHAQQNIRQALQVCLWVCACMQGLNRCQWAG